MYSVSESHIKYTLWNFLDPLLCSIFSWICSLVAVFLPDLGIAALSHFFRKCCTIISLKGPKVARKEKTYYKTYASIWHIDTFLYNASPNLIQLVMASLENTHHYLRLRMWKRWVNCICISRDSNPMWWKIGSNY